MEDKYTLKTIQPYFIMGTTKYEKKLIQKYGIAHIYEFTMDLLTDTTITAVPDGCIDILIDCTQEKQAYVYGTVLEHKIIENQYGHQYFGVRFMPGVLPKLINTCIEDLVDCKIELEYVIREKHLSERIAEAKSFEQRVNLFMKAYLRFLVNDSENQRYGKTYLADTLKRKIFITGGEISIHELEKFTGYSSRYINKVFHEVVGVNPKTFCSIMKFQTVIEHLNHDTDTRLSDLAVTYGYYDQAQFIRDFRKCTNMTPKEYRKKIVDINYNSRILIEPEIAMNYYFEKNGKIS